MTGSSYPKDQIAVLPAPSATSSFISEINNRVVKLENNVSQLYKKVKQISEEIPRVVNVSINSLPSEKYEVIEPISVILKIYIDETLALLPELELYGEGQNEIEALKDLKLELIELMEDFEEIPEEKLGKNPKSWKKTLNKLIMQCQ